MRCYRQTLCTQYKDHVTNKGVRAKIQQAIGPHEDHLTIVKRRKLQWTCLPFIRSGQNHFTSHSERGKTIRRTEEEVEDNIRKWTGLEFAKFQRVMKDSEKWRKLVVKSSSVPKSSLAVKR